MIATKVIDIRKIGTDKAVIRLRPVARFSYQAGQYVELTFDGCEPRFYSIANAPVNDDLKVHDIEIHIKDNGKGGAATHALKSLTRDDAVALRGPFGEGTWKPESGRPLLMVAGGMGIAPLKAVAEDALANGHVAPVTIYWGVGQNEDRYVQDELTKMAVENANLNYVSVVGNPVSEIVAEYEKNLQDFEIYLAGPPDMISAIVPHLLSAGAAPDSIHSDHDVLLKAVLAGDA